MGLAKGRGYPQSLGGGGVSALFGCSISPRVLPAAAVESHRGNVSHAPAVVSFDVQRVPGWAGGVCAPLGGISHPDPSPKNLGSPTQGRVWGGTDPATMPPGSLRDGGPTGPQWWHGLVPDPGDLLR